MSIKTLAVSAFIGPAAGQLLEQRKERKAQKAIRNIGQATEQVRNRGARRRAVREARIKRASIIQRAENTGVGRSSSEIGGLSSIESSLGGQIALQRTEELASQGISFQNKKIASARDTITSIGRADGVAQKIFSYGLAG